MAVIRPVQDSLIWKYRLLIINFRGITPIYIPAVWSLHVPPKIHVFLWLVSHNRIMTRDNLKKRNIKKPEGCVFCSEKEIIHHLFL